MAGSTRCRGLFATHYHSLATDHGAKEGDVAIMHMACAVSPSANGSAAEEVTFLYKLSAGACPKSYGTNVARLAGLPQSVVDRAAAISEKREAALAAAAAGNSGAAASGAAVGAATNGAARENASEAPAPMAVDERLVASVQKVASRLRQLGGGGMDAETATLLLAGLQQAC